MTTLPIETPAPAETDRQLRADARRNRERILESAREAFAEGGADAQMDDVARRAGVGVGTVYRHFPTKEALVAEIVRQKFRIMGENARAALEYEGEPFGVFADLLRTNAEFCARDAGIQEALDRLRRVRLGLRPGGAPAALHPHSGADGKGATCRNDAP